MRGTWSVALALLALSGFGCANKPNRVLRKPTVQCYDLPPSDQFLKPPTYPEDKPVLPSQKKVTPMNGAGSGGGGASPGGPGMGGNGMGGAGGSNAMGGAGGGRPY